jgi:hypothetical protein
MPFYPASRAGGKPVERRQRSIATRNVSRHAAGAERSSGDNRLGGETHDLLALAKGLCDVWSGTPSIAQALDSNDTSWPAIERHHAMVGAWLLHLKRERGAA